MTNKILNEENDLSSLVEKLVANWLSKTGGEPAKVEDLVAFLQDPKIQRVLPYNEEITDDIINTIASKRVAKGFGQKKTSTDSKQQQSNSRQQSGPAGKSNEKQQVAYVERLKKVIDGLQPAEKQALSRMLG